MTSNPAWIIEWEVAHLGDDNFDVQLIPFPGSEESQNLLLAENLQLPDQVLFEANFNSLNAIDYPYNDVSWPIMSNRMLEVIGFGGPLACEKVPLIMVDDTVPSKERYDEDGEVRSEIIRQDFAAVGFREEKDFFDYEESVYERDPDFPDFVMSIDQLVLRKPSEGYPAMFRIAAFPTPLFVSDDTKIKLVNAQISGVEFIPITEFQG